MTTPQEIHDDLEDRCSSVALIETDEKVTADVRVGIMVMDTRVGHLLVAEVGAGPDGRPAATLRAIDEVGDPLALTVFEVDGEVMVST